MPLPAAEVPKWPDFSLTLEVHHGADTWVARTDTDRPGTPIFSMGLTSIPEAMSREEAEVHFRSALDERYRQAHPNGCPVR